MKLFPKTGVFKNRQINANSRDDGMGKLLLAIFVTSILLMALGLKALGLLGGIIGAIFGLIGGLIGLVAGFIGLIIGLVAVVGGILLPLLIVVGLVVGVVKLLAAI